MEDQKLLEKRSWDSLYPQKFTKGRNGTKQDDLL